MRNGRVIMGTAVRQFEYVNKKYLRQVRVLGGAGLVFSRLSSPLACGRGVDLGPT
jgi:hypothetical protein